MTRAAAPLVRTVDSALPSRQFTRLANAIRALGAERLRAGYQTTFWYDFEREPSNLVERAIDVLRTNVGQTRGKRARGVEWWLSRMRTSNVKVDFHRDRDNAWFDERGEERTPLLSTLLYCTRCTGGLLAVTTQPVNPRNPAFAPDVHDFDFVAPEPNRFAYFDGRLVHGVLDSKNQIPHARRKTERTWRVAIAMNYWASRPLRVPRYGETHHYRALAV